MFIASLLLLGIGTTVTTIGAVCLIGWIIKKLTEVSN